MGNKKALLIGNDNYSNAVNLSGCLNDTKAMEPLLQYNENGTRNFFTNRLNNLSNNNIKREIRKFLKRNSDYAMLYFSGHGYIDNNGGYLCGVDASKDKIGVSMTWISSLINDSKIPEIALVLDCCHAGAIFNVSSEGGELALLRQGVTVLAATSKNDTAAEFLDKGIFTSILEKGLKGAAKDVMGNVTLSGLYACAKNALNPFQQGPVFKSFVHQVTPIRICKPIISEIDLRKIVTKDFFQDLDSTINVNPDILIQRRAEFDISHDTYLMLHTYEKAGLIECDENKTLIETTMGWGKCHLSTYGKYIWQLVKEGNF